MGNTAWQIAQRPRLPMCAFETTASSPHCGQAMVNLATTPGCDMNAAFALAGLTAAEIHQALNESHQADNEENGWIDKQQVEEK